MLNPTRFRLQGYGSMIATLQEELEGEEDVNDKTFVLQTTQV
jgi:hypothetical protein